MITRLKAEKYNFQFEDYRLDNMIEEVVFETKEIAKKKNIRFNINMCTNCENIRYDHYLVRKAFFLIIENAIKHSPEKGIIHITGSNDGINYIVKIIDQGNGFSSESFETVFDMFTSDEIMHHKEGFGMGLATVKIIMDSHNGFCQVANIDGGGAEITMNFILSNNTQETK